MLSIDSYFIDPNKKGEDYFEWGKNNIDIIEDNGKKVFTQEDVEFPKQWSQLARKIVASKYLFGEGESRENSLKDLVKRVSSTFSQWAIHQKYFDKKNARNFKEELAYLVYNQSMSFNSPVWFNVGINNLTVGSKEKKEGYIIKNGKTIPLPIGKELIYPQTAACFIQNVEDTMEGIMELAKIEALLFKYGSGSGTNLSTLRSSRERLSGGGKPSGPLAYWAFFDKVAGIVKSGGKTRRASKMDILNVNHPDIKEFIHSKKDEEQLLHILIDNGIPWQRAQESVNYQNTNISVRASDIFMNASLKDLEWQTIPVHNKDMINEMPKYKAKKMLREIAEAAYFCGDPGIQFHDTINRWHTCKDSGIINASNPCSEFMFLDNSSCNLASQNLMAFMKNGSFDTQAFENSIKITTIAQDLEIDNSFYPTKKIAENSNKFRPLGMGYANLGSLIMSLGLPYDSNESRAIASSITALMTGKVYEVSTELAEDLGPFEEFEKNRNSMLEVIKMHKDALNNIQIEKIPNGLENILYRAKEIWDNVLERGEKYGFKNSQATVLAPTGTIGFMMDCDTKGIEPEIGLIQTKLLVGGGRLKLVNRTVEPTLRMLGYKEKQIEEIQKYIAGNNFEGTPQHVKLEELEEIKEKPLELRKILKKKGYSETQINEVDSYINGHETIEGAPYIKEEHLPIFDCSNKPKYGKRTISPMGHLKMMAAVQPFLSGAISKTVNFPEEATVEEMEQTYIDAWKMGIKSVALYRDNSKRIQPLNFSKKVLEEKIKPVRRKLPDIRDSCTNKFEIAGHEGYLIIGKYKDGTPGETFMDMSKEGSTIKGLMAALGISVSMGLQHGVPLENYVKKFRHQKFEPYGITKGHVEIHTSDSIVDYIAQFLGKEFLKGYNENGIENNSPVKIAIEKQKDDEKESSEPAGGFCAQCGNQMIKKGNCMEVCSVCDWENPKGCGE